MTRENWGTRVGFILAAAGSAIGLGNIWRFPGVAYENGGGAFLLPYLIALLTAGIPLLILEFTIGRRYRGAAPVAFRRLHKNLEFVGWWQVAISVVIAVYYAAVIGWAAWYTFFAFRQTWGDDPFIFFLQDFVGHLSPEGEEAGLYDFGVYMPQLMIMMVVIWALALLIIGGGVRRGIETANKIFIPLLVLMFGVLVVQALTLEGAVDGLNQFFTPDWGVITRPGTWVAAYGQIFFSLSIGFGIMITYASYLKRKSELTTSAMTVGFANSSFEILAGIGVFSALGYLALQTGEAIGDQRYKGVFLAFAVFPEIINTLPVAAGLFGTLFFASLTVAGLSSLISIIQVPVAAVQDRFGVSRRSATLFVGGGMAVVSIGLFPTFNGLMLLDVSDFFVNRFGIAVAAPVAIVAVVWVLWKWKELRDDANATSVFKIGNVFLVCLGVITPIVLAVMLIWSAVRLANGIGEEGDYTPFQTYGWSIAAGVLLVGLILGLLLRNRAVPSDAEHESGLAETEPSTDAGEEVSK